jgi:acyl-CoA synthetase (AMP-forming)/AMP-acid ligase II
MGASAASVFETFRHRWGSAPETPLYTTVDEAGNDRRHLNVRETGEATDAVAGFLVQDCGLRPGDRAVLAYTPSMDFVIAFVACIRAGVVPVPVVPPDPTGPRGPGRVRRFSAICKAVDAKAILANRDYMRRRLVGQVLRVFRSDRPEWPRLPWHVTDTVAAGSFPAPAAIKELPGDLAFIQYTSGATGEPKGVRITHGNLRHQLEANAQVLELGADTRCVFWVPHFHDLCLISGILSALSGNGHLYLMSPLAFVQKPAVWFEVMSRVRATHTAAPNLAFELAVRKTTPEQRKRWDLSSLRYVMTAAEPIRHSTVKTFYDTFAGTGLRIESLCPAYGLAEHSVGVAVGGRKTLRVDREALEYENVVRPADDQASVADSTVLVGCGRPISGASVRIVDADTRTPLPDERVGEIWVRSLSVADGYIELAANRSGDFDARLSVQHDDGAPWLRTGDLGFLHRGELFFTGRVSDVIQLGARTLYPQDVEETVRDAHALIRPGCVVACPVSAGGSSGLAIVAELRSTWVSGPLGTTIADAIRRRVAEEHREPCALVWLGRPGSIPKTTSGKLMRTRCQDLLAGADPMPGHLHVMRPGGQAADSRLRRRPAAHTAAWPR